MNAVARRCLSCQQWFTPKRRDARTCSDKCRVALQRAGGVSTVQKTLKRPVGWWDDVRTVEVREPSGTDMWYCQKTPNTATIELPPDLIARLRDGGGATLKVIVVDAGGVTDRSEKGVAS